MIDGLFVPLLHPDAPLAYGTSAIHNFCFHALLRLPLCLNIVGNLIRTCGEGWEEAVPGESLWCFSRQFVIVNSFIERWSDVGVLRNDMSSLMQEGNSSADSLEQEPMSMQQRVIQSGLDSIKGKDAPKIVRLFKSMAVFQVCGCVPRAAQNFYLCAKCFDWSLGRPGRAFGSRQC